jgi:hypothetical protein
VVTEGQEIQVLLALNRITTEVGYMLEAPTKHLIVTAETQLAFDEALRALKEIRGSSRASE